MRLDDLISELNEHGRCSADLTEDEAVQAFTEACRRVDNDPQERQRVRNIAALTDAEDIEYKLALATVERGDWKQALPILRHCAEAGIGDSVLLLAVALETTGNIAEAVSWYKAAADEGDPSAETRLTELTSRPGPGGGSGPAGSESLAVNFTGDSLRGKTPLYHELRLPSISQDEVYKGIGSAGITLFFVEPKGDSRLYQTHTQPLRPPFPGGWLVDSNAIMNVLSWVPTTLQRGKSSIYDGAWADAVTYETMFLQVRDYSKAFKRNVVESIVKPSLLPEPYIVAASPVKPDLVHDSVRGASFAVFCNVSLESARLPEPQSTVRTFTDLEGLAIADVMLDHSELSACSPDTTVLDALITMLRSDTAILPVYARGKAVGVVTASQLAWRQQPRRTVKDLMRPVTEIAAHAPVWSALERAARDTSRLLIVIGDNGALVGYLPIDDDKDYRQREQGKRDFLFFEDLAQCDDLFLAPRSRLFNSGSNAEIFTGKTKLSHDELSPHWYTLPLGPATSLGHRSSTVSTTNAYRSPEDPSPRSSLHSA